MAFPRETLVPPRWGSNGEFGRRWLSERPFALFPALWRSAPAEQRDKRLKNGVVHGRSAGIWQLTSLQILVSLGVLQLGPRGGSGGTFQGNEVMGMSLKSKDCVLVWWRRYPDQSHCLILRCPTMYVNIFPIATKWQLGWHPEPIAQTGGHLSVSWRWEIPFPAQTSLLFSS